MRRLKLPALLLLITLLAVTLVIIANVISNRDPVIRIATRTQWDSAAKHKRLVVFVDGDWNSNVVMFRQPFEQYALWCQTDTDVVTSTMLIDAKDTTNDVWNICEQLWRSNNIDPGSLKTFGGAGRVVWIEQGQVVDYAWCWELLNHDDIDDIGMLKVRTKDAFNLSIPISSMSS